MGDNESAYPSRSRQDRAKSTFTITSSSGGFLPHVKGQRQREARTVRPGRRERRREAETDSVIRARVLPRVAGALRLFRYGRRPGARGAMRVLEREIAVDPLALDEEAAAELKEEVLLFGRAWWRACQAFGPVAHRHGGSPGPLDVEGADDDLGAVLQETSDGVVVVRLADGI